ncbi:MAG: hypothetical protein F4X21_02750 [Acidimicrobiia bacterium]|nr:hypothetical protein [Acidimicrobiia bacterium]
MQIVKNFMHNGLTNHDTTIEIEDIVNSRGVLTGNKVTVRCSPYHDCTWNRRGPVPDEGEPGYRAGLEPGDVYAVRMPNPDGLFDPYYEVHNFTSVLKEVTEFEVEDYQEPEQEDVDKQRNPKGTVPANPRSRTATYSVPGHLTCGDLFGQAYVWTVKEELLVATYYVEVYQRDDNGDVVVPFVVTGCVLRDPDEPYHPIVEEVDANGDTIINTSTGLPQFVKASEPQMRRGRPVTAGEALPATRTPITDCSQLDGEPKGSECVVTHHEYTSMYKTETLENGSIITTDEVLRPDTGRLPSVTHPGNPPEFEPPTQREVKACNRRSDHETCINKLEADALDDYYRALEAHDAKVRRYEQEVENLYYHPNDDSEDANQPRGEQFWVCTTYDQWKQDIEEGMTTGQRCYLVG